MTEVEAELQAAEAHKQALVRAITAKQRTVADRLTRELQATCSDFDSCVAAHADWLHSALDHVDR
jgi:hypothetical protein